MAERSVGRPKIELDSEQVEKLASIGCTVIEIADFFKCSDDTIHRNYAAELDKGRAKLKISLRQMQIDAAQRGNVAMMIWLGKQLLGQVDRAQLDVHKIPDDVFIEEAQRRLKSGSSGSS